MNINQLSELPRRGRSFLVLTGDAKGFSVFPFHRFCSSYVISYVHSHLLLAQFVRLVERRAIEEPSVQNGSFLSSAPGPKCNRTAPVFIQASAVQILVVE
jgi:hypothetical protein